MRTVPVDFACNDPDDGTFSGKVWMANIDGNDVERGQGEVAFTLAGNRFRIHRKLFDFSDSRDWVGNWCWNRFWLTPREANRLASHLRDNGWRCTCGDERFYDFMNKPRALEARKP